MRSPSADRRPGPDACPGALAVHPAADGGLARVRLPGGRLGSSALAVLAGAAQELGSGVLELTSRGNVQVRGVRAGAEAELAARVADAGLLPSPTHERVRNIVASPLTGLQPGGRPDVSWLVRDLDSGLCADGAFVALGGRFLFAVDDGSTDVSALGADVGLLALGGGGYALLLAGTDSGRRVPSAAAAQAALAAATAFLAERAVRGPNAWRVAELPGGPAGMLARLPFPGGPGGVPDDALTVPRPPEPGVLGQADGLVALVVLAPAGRLSGAAATALARAADPVLGVRVTPWRSVVLPGMDPEAAPAVAAGLAGYGLVTDPASPWAGVTACAGTPGCARALADVRGAAAAAVPAQRSAGRPLPVHWAACERRCGRPSGRHVDVVATAAGFEVRMDGRLVAAGDARLAASAAATERIAP